ncbi:MAG: hypothetical protein IT182_06915 [Acidobacteria bacterium]|nr:hypothetical protein [Acidobacteriota bacterium]
MAARKGATRAADIHAEVRHALSRGEMQSATLAECLAVNQATLARAVFPDLPVPALGAIDSACERGILKRMTRIGAVLLDEVGEAGIAQCRSHGADTERGWACSMVGAQSHRPTPPAASVSAPSATSHSLFRKKEKASRSKATRALRDPLQMQPCLLSRPQRTSLRTGRLSPRNATVELSI